MKNKYYLGIDAGNGTSKVVIIDEKNRLIDSVYLENQGVIQTISKAFKKIKHYPISSCGIIGARRKITSIIVGSDIIKTELLAHTIGVLDKIKDVRTIIDLGNEDSKKIMVKNGIMEGSNMNITCSSGCGSYLENVALRLDIKIEDFETLALQSKNEVHIDAMCSVFGSKSAKDLSNMGIAKEDILMGVANSLVRNYKNMFISGKVEGPIVFTGGVSKNKSVVKAFGDQLKCKIIVPENSHLIGAIGAAILAKKENPKKTKFKGFDLNEEEYDIKPFICSGCGNACNIPIAYNGNKKIGISYSGKCGKY